MALGLWQIFQTEKSFQFALQSSEERLKNVHTFDFVFPTSLARCEPIQQPQTLTTGDLSPYKQNIVTRFCTSCAFIQYNNTGIKCNKKTLLKHILKTTCVEGKTVTLCTQFRRAFGFLRSPVVF